MTDNEYRLIEVIGLICVGLLAANILILTLCLKVYTEIVKIIRFTKKP